MTADERTTLADLATAVEWITTLLRKLSNQDTAKSDELDSREWEEAWKAFARTHKQGRDQFSDEPDSVPLVIDDIANLGGA